MHDMRLTWNRRATETCESPNRQNYTKWFCSICLQIHKRNYFASFTHIANMVYLFDTYGLLPGWPDWAIYWTLGHFLKPFATINLPKSSTFLVNSCQGVKIIHFLVKSFLGNFYRHLAIFIWSHWLLPKNTNGYMWCVCGSVLDSRLKKKHFELMRRHLAASQEWVVELLGE